jgi:hypothetical protein
MTETTFSQANPAFAPNPHTDDPEPEVREVEVMEFGNEEPVAVYEEPVYEEPQPVDEPVDEEPLDEEPVEEEPPADEE